MCSTQSSFVTKWLKSPKFDMTFFFGPLFIILIATVIIKYIFPESLTLIEDPVWLYLMIITIDVTHVYGSLYRSYFNKAEFSAHKVLYILSPILVVLSVATLILFDRTGFTLIWLVALFAVWHCVKQQLGFVFIYAGKENGRNVNDRRMDTLISWSITMTPMLYWWAHLDDRNYVWFQSGEFMKMPETLFPAIWVLFGFVIVGYIIHEFVRIKEGREANLLKYAYILMTAFVWFNGIVWNNSLLIFAFGNVLLHRANYTGIAYLSTMNKYEKGEYPTFPWVRWILNKGFLAFFLLLLGFAIFEEYWLDQMTIYGHSAIWGSTFYEFSKSMPDIFYALIIGLLMMPQLTHYFQDGLVWRKEYDPSL